MDPVAALANALFDLNMLQTLPDAPDARAEFEAQVRGTCCANLTALSEWLSKGGAVPAVRELPMTLDGTISYRVGTPR
jgi:hypothetical protein